MSTTKTTKPKTTVPSKTTTTPAKKPSAKSSSSADSANPQKQRIVQNVLLVWLDASIDVWDESCQKTLTQLRSVVNAVRTFTDSNLCAHFLNEIQEEQVLMIISGGLGQSVVPVIHSKPQLNAIYIFCSNKTHHEKWVKSWSKIKGVYTQMTLILESLKHDVKQCNQDSVAVSFVSSMNQGGESLDQLEASFMYTQIFKEILFEQEYDRQAVRDLVHYCCEQYHNNPAELEVIDQFEKDYHPEKAIWWYTRECFTYQMLNRALRTLEYDIIINMGFFIRDLHRAIGKLHALQFGTEQKQTFVVYRGQGLSIQDFQKLQKTRGGLMSFNSFLSTSKQEDVSLGFAKSVLARTEFVGVLFKMVIDSSTSSTPFALIDEHSYFDAEKEVLFSMHTIFRIGEISKLDDSGRLYQVLLTLTSDNDQQLQALTERIREETSPNAQGWYRLGELLLKLGQFNKAEQVYDGVLRQTSDTKDQGNIYYQLGRIKSHQDDDEQALLFYQKALEVDQQALPADHQSLAEIYNNMGAVYDNMKDYAKARLYYGKALEINQKHLPADHPDLATLYNNIGLLCDNMEEYSGALSFYQKALEIKEKTLPANHPGLATAYNNIATVYNNMKEYSRGLSFYERALTIEQKTLPPNHPDLATTYNNIGWVYRNMKNYSKALVFYENALHIKQRILPPNHPSIEDVSQSIESCKKKL